MKTGKKTANHSSVIKYYDKKGHTISSGIDTLVLDLGIDNMTTKRMMQDFMKFTANTNTEYYSLSGFEGITFSNHYSPDTRFGTALTVYMQHEEFPHISAFNIFLSKNSRKITLYGMLFRLCQLLKIDRRTLTKAILAHFELSQELSAYRVIRLDYKLDIFNVKPQKYYTRLKDYNKRNKTTIGEDEISYKKAGHLQTIYLGSKKSKFAYCRIYDKFVDVTDKEKQLFYHDYPNPTTRIEWQFGYKFIGNSNIEELIYKIASYCGFDSSFTGSYYVAHRYSPHMIADVEKYETDYRNRGLKLAQNGIDTSKTHEIVNIEFQKSQKRHKRFISLHRFHGKKEDSKELEV